MMNDQELLTWMWIESECEELEKLEELENLKESEELETSSEELETLLEKLENSLDKLETSLEDSEELENLDDNAPHFTPTPESTPIPSSTTQSTTQSTTPNLFSFGVLFSIFLGGALVAWGLEWIVREVVGMIV